jgi:hypothetical protein
VEAAAAVDATTVAGATMEVATLAISISSFYNILSLTFYKNRPNLANFGGIDGFYESS